MDLDFLSNFVIENEEEKELDEKKEILKFLKQIGVDSRFVSVYQHDSDDKDSIRLYIENLRFSKFSKKRINLFKTNFNFSYITK